MNYWVCEMRRRAVHYCLLGNILTPLKIKLASASFRQSFYFFRQKWDEGYSFFEEEEDEQTVNNPETPDFQSWVDLAWFFFLAACLSLRWIWLCYIRWCGTNHVSAGERENKITRFLPVCTQLQQLDLVKVVEEMIHRVLMSPQICCYGCTCAVGIL